MKRPIFIVILGIVLGATGGTCVYLTRTAPERAIQCCQNPEQAWLQHEFQMTDAQMARVRQLDAQYQTGCRDLCRRIHATNDLVSQQFTSHASVTAEINQSLTNAAQMRAECQSHMLEYCYAVSREMTPAQGRRYLQWVSDKALAMPGDSAMSHPK